MNAFDLAALCSLDSLFASAVVGLLASRRSEQGALVLAFGLFDAAASWIGWRFPVAWPDAMLMIVCVVLASAAFAGRFGFGRSGFLLLLPLALSLDNLTSPATGPDWVFVGLGSALMSLLGFGMAAVVGAGLSRHHRDMTRGAR